MVSGRFGLTLVGWFWLASDGLGLVFRVSNGFGKCWFDFGWQVLVGWFLLFPMVSGKFGFTLVGVGWFWLFFDGLGLVSKVSNVFGKVCFDVGRF